MIINVSIDAIIFKSDFTIQQFWCHIVLNGEFGDFNLGILIQLLAHNMALSSW